LKYSVSAGIALGIRGPDNSVIAVEDKIAICLHDEFVNAIIIPLSPFMLYLSTPPFLPILT
jgi:hypothetical protein